MLVCVDCVQDARRRGKPAPGEPGGPKPRKIVDGVRKPRCREHKKEQRAGVSARRHGQHVVRTYSISEERYWQLYEAQDGRCGVCRWAQGKARRLAVDHDHSCCSGKTSCGKCVRGLLCVRCNQYVVTLGVEGLLRAVAYLKEPPACFVA